MLYNKGRLKKQKNMTQEIKIIFFRFLRGFLAGGVASMTTFLATSNATSWNDFQNWIGALTFALTIGGITGGILALDKYFRLETVASSKKK